jgi:hypothetical protein
MTLDGRLMGDAFEEVDPIKALHPQNSAPPFVRNHEAPVAAR